MPVHGGERFLAATLASAAGQANEGIEFRLYNSGQDAGAARDIARSFTDRLDIHWRETPELPSWMAKTNLGVREARAPHVAMLHQDDLWLPGHAAALRQSISEHASAVLSIAPTRFADTRGQILGHWRLPFRAGQVNEALFVATLLVQNSISIPTPLIRRDAWLAMDGMDEALWYTADWDMYLRLAAQGRVVVRKETTTAFRLHGASLTMTGSRDAAAFRDQLERVVDRHLARLPAARRQRVGRRARASIEVNCALAQASSGNKAALAHAGLQILRLGANDLFGYVAQSRIVDRLIPRLKLAASGRI
jgi:hypothetical protein